MLLIVLVVLETVGLVLSVIYTEDDGKYLAVMYSVLGTLALFLRLYLNSIIDSETISKSIEITIIDSFMYSMFIVALFYFFYYQPAKLSSKWHFESSLMLHSVSFSVTGTESSACPDWPE